MHSCEVLRDRRAYVAKTLPTQERTKVESVSPKGSMLFTESPFTLEQSIGPLSLVSHFLPDWPYGSILVLVEDW